MHTNILQYLLIRFSVVCAVLVCIDLHCNMSFLKYRYSEFQKMVGVASGEGA